MRLIQAKEKMLLVTWLIVAAVSIALAQDARPDAYQDSLQSVLDGRATRAHKKEALFLLGEYLVQRDPDYADSIAERLKKDFIDPENVKEVQRTAYILAAANRWQGDYATAIAIYQNLYDSSKQENDSLNIAKSGQFIGTLSMFIGQQIAAQQYLVEAAGIYARKGTPRQNASIQNGLASFYLGIDQKEKAEEWYHKALQQFTTLNDSAGMASVHANLGMLYTDLGQFKKAEDNLLRQKELNAVFPTLREMGFHYDFLGKLRQKEGKFEQAYENVMKALRIRENLSSTYNLCESKLNVGEILIRQKRYPEAIKHLQQVFSYQEHNSLSQQQRAYELLSQAYENSGDFQEALANFKAYKRVSDSIYSEKSIRIIAEKDAEYNIQRQRDEIEILNKEKEIASSQLLRSRTLLYSTITGLVLILTAAVVFFILYDKIKSKNQLIYNTLQEKELLLYEIHHRVKNNLQMISSLLNLQSKHVSDRNAFEALQKGRHRVKSMAILHKQLYSGKKITDVDMNLYLRELAHNLVEQHTESGKTPELEFFIHNVVMKVETAIPIGLIVNELLTNSLKHAFPGDKPLSGKIEISMEDSQHDASWLLTVSDNGVGFQPKPEEATDSFGRRLVNLLAQRLRATVQIGQNEGTSVTIRIPYQGATEESQ